ncbi:p-loop containing nucleoside triphosphate hydrolase protein [Mycena venus]|uniref:DNA 3'-5' helicase n=1 Tax=Mycena venus TaxID=2733690 RepID=A0A8H7CL15_9AGAR|nr:p-loop containing nucleoside triphosphate hydrolase protein [Mycena venus]
MVRNIRWQDSNGLETLRTIVKKVLPQWKDGLRPVQEELVAPILDGAAILCCTATGDGKSAAFSVPILVLNEYNANRHLYPPNLPTRERPVGLVVTPTKGLADNIVLELTKLGIAAFSYCRESLADARRNRIDLATEIKECKKYSVICVDPEHLREKDWRVISEWPAFRSNILFTTIDEVHLINEWGPDFRPSFRMIGIFVRGRLPPSTSIVGLSATLAPGKDTAAVCKSLGFYGNSFHLIRRSNERPNIQFIVQTLTHGLAGYEFPDLLPYLMSGRKISIHCSTLDMVFRVYVYIWRLQPPEADKLRRTRMETIRLIDEDPHCQIIVATIAFSNGINAKSILDSISLGFSSTLDILLQEKGRAGREAGSLARGIVLVQPSMLAAAAKQVQGPAPPPSTNEPPKKTNNKKARAPPAAMPHEKAQLLTETHCYISVINRHYSNPPLETTSLDCIAANRPLPCSLCSARAKRTIVFPAPPSAVRLPPIAAPPVVVSQKSSTPRKLKLSRKERESATAALITCRDKIRVKEQLAGNFRNMPPILFLPSTLQTVLLDKFLSINTESDLVSLVRSWQHRQRHTKFLFDSITKLQRQIRTDREAARLAKNAKAQATRNAKRKRIDDNGDDGDLPSHRTRRKRIRRVVEDSAAEDEGEDSDSYFPEVLLPKKTPSARPARTALGTVTNVPRTTKRRTKSPTHSAAETAAGYGPRYKPRIRR